MSWKSIADMIVQSGDAQIALVGAPMEAGSVTPGRCDLAPEIVRKTLRRFSTYDVETGKELDLRILDAGDADVRDELPPVDERPNPALDTLDRDALQTEIERGDRKSTRLNSSH